MSLSNISLFKNRTTPPSFFVYFLYYCVLYFYKFIFLLELTTVIDQHYSLFKNRTTSPSFLCIFLAFLCFVFCISIFFYIFAGTNHCHWVNFKTKVGVHHHLVHFFFCCSDPPIDSCNISEMMQSMLVYGLQYRHTCRANMTRFVLSLISWYIFETD